MVSDGKDLKDQPAPTPHRDATTSSEVSVKIFKQCKQLLAILK